MKLVDVSYYGNCDEDDGVIVPQEAVYEQEGIEMSFNILGFVQLLRIKLLNGNIVKHLTLNQDIHASRSGMNLMN